MKQWRAMLAW